MKKYGITGGIACGKSTVGELLAEAGVRLVDADVIARDLVEPGAAGYQKVIDAFGKKILNEDRSINRQLVGELVFRSQEQRKILNSILHPLVIDQCYRDYGEILEKDSSKPVAIIIPLLHEVNSHEWFDEILCVGCSVATQVKRLQCRGYDEKGAHARMGSQLSVSEKMKRSDIVVWNEGSMRMLEKQVQAVVKRWSASVDE